VNPASIQVEVAYVRPDERPDRAIVRRLQLGEGSTLADAVRASGLLQYCPEIDLGRNRTGIFGRLANLDAPLRDGDRVEVYRGLAVDPKEARRRRARPAGKRA
jgi:uncharacterized protein